MSGIGGIGGAGPLYGGCEMLAGPDTCRWLEIGRPRESADGGGAGPLGYRDRAPSGGPAVSGLGAGEVKLKPLLGRSGGWVVLGRTSGLKGAVAGLVLRCVLGGPSVSGYGTVEMGRSAAPGTLGGPSSSGYGVVVDDRGGGAAPL